jgi:TolA-binding protein
MRTALIVLAGLVLAAPAAGQDDPKTRFWEARRVLLKGDAASAAELFRTVLVADPKSEVADDCLYWMGRCYLRLKDREPDAAVALNRLVRDFPESPFIADAARELAAMGDRSLVPLLRKRGAAKALAEFGEEPKSAAAPAADKPEAGLAAEVRLLEEEVKRLRREVDEALALVKKLLQSKEETQR